MKQSVSKPWSPDMRRADRDLKDAMDAYSNALECYRKGDIDSITLMQYKNKLNQATENILAIRHRGGQC